MHTKHKVLTFALVFIIVFLGLAVWYLATKPQHPAGTEMATSTSATTTPAAVSTLPTPSAAHLSESAAYYTVDMQYPTGNVFGAAQASAEANAAAVAAMQQYAATTTVQFKTDGGFAHLTKSDIQTMGLGERKEALSSTYKVYAGSRTVSYAFTIYEDTLGAHPNTFFKTFTFDTATGKPLSLSDLFIPGSKYLTFLSTQSRTDIPKLIDKKAGAPGMSDAEMIKSGTTADEVNFQDFYIDGKNFVLLFPPYQVAAYAVGDLADSIPLSTLASILKPEYR